MSQQLFCHQCARAVASSMPPTVTETRERTILACPICGSEFVEEIPAGGRQATAAGGAAAAGPAGVVEVQINALFQHLPAPFANIAQAIMSRLQVAPQGLNGPPMFTMGVPMGGHFGDYAQSNEALDRILHRLFNEASLAGGVPPAPEAVIHSLPRVVVGPEDAERDCAVCQDNFEVGSEVLVLPCAHRFHGDCITPWLQMHASCPVCRARVNGGGGDSGSFGGGMGAAHSGSRAS